MSWGSKLCIRIIKYQPLCSTKCCCSADGMKDSVSDGRSLVPCVVRYRSFVHSLALIHPIQREQQYNWEGWFNSNMCDTNERMVYALQHGRRTVGGCDVLHPLASSSSHPQIFCSALEGWNKMADGLSRDWIHMNNVRHTYIFRAFGAPGIHYYSISPSQMDFPSIHTQTRPWRSVGPFVVSSSSWWLFLGRYSMSLYNLDI